MVHQLRIVTVHFLATMLIIGGAGLSSAEASTFVVDCSKGGPAALVKKFDMSQTGYSDAQAWMRTARNRIGPLKLRHIRIIGVLHHKLMGGEPALTEVLELIRKEGASPYLGLDPNVLEPGRRSKKPLDMPAWKGLLTDLARQAKQYGTVYYEVWNEPNYELFFDGTQDELFELYRVMVETVRQVDPAAKFAGPAITSGGVTKWTRPFLQYLDQHELPLHAFSFHEFGRDYDVADQWIIENGEYVIEQLDRFERFKDTQIHIGECSFFADPKDGDRADRAEAAAHLPEFFRILISRPRISLIQWAQLFDTGSKGLWGNLGVIDIETSKPKPVYNVFMMYAMMPVESIAYEEMGIVRGLASIDRGKKVVAVMLYNMTGQASHCRLMLGNHPFCPQSKIHLTRLAVDKDHSSFWEKAGSSGQLELIEQTTLSVPSGGWDSKREIRRTIKVPGPGVQLLLFSADKLEMPYGVVSSKAAPAETVRQTTQSTVR